MKFIVDDQQNVTVTLDQSVVRRSAQKQAFKQMLKDNRITDAIAYLESFKAKGYTSVDVPRIQSEDVDKLSEKHAGSIYRSFQRMFDVNREHRPDTEHQTYIGVEIECMVPHRAFRHIETSGGSYECDNCGGSGTYTITDDNGDDVDTESCNDCGGSGRHGSDDDENNSEFLSALAEHFRSKKVKYINVKADGSIRADGDYFPCEITILTRLDKPTNLEMACNVLNKLGAKVNKSCGMHVHLDARHLTARQVLKVGAKFTNAMPVLLGMVPMTRRKDNQYCRPSVSGLKGDRYFAVNLTAHRKYKTMEVRLHSSTTDFKKIISWARLIHSISVAKKVPMLCRDINELSDFITIDERLMEYVAQRTSLFSDNPSDTCTSSEARDADAA